jgi:hypothetical protein
VKWEGIGDVTESLPPKEIICTCGNRFISQQRSNWCRSCGKQVFYDPKDAGQSRRNRMFVMALLLIIVTFLVYFFIELIVTPMMHLRSP